ncbi:uncharacterized protein LOC115810779 [Chanos chanos]|uniref:Uncharacterized protein LOC115810779 n=1 Tax=Chanos chanos TaxID=29144 RepID=A0A6J2V9V8_CHACN|nr:uncharacterized protein LOC115810779 [Chanos chanos]
MRGSLLGILLFFKYSICADELNFEGDIRDFAVGNNKVYVLTDDRLHQMRHNLTIETERYISNATHSNRVNILVYFGSNKTLITCGTLNCGYCEVLDENDITKSLHRESISVGPWRKASSVAFIVDIKSQKYLLVGKENEESPCGTSNFVSLWNTQDEQYGGIFSKSNTRDTPTPPYIHSEKKVQLVDGFQLNLSSYLFLNVMTENGSASLKVQLLRTENKGTKADTLKSLRGATLKCCEDKQRRRLLSSTVIKDTEEVLWAGVFSAENARDTANNALTIYDISQELSEVHDFCDLKENAPAECKPVGRAGQDEKILTPKTVVFRYRSILSVAAEKNEPWVALFIGTEEGQLIKLVLDKDLNPTCPMVLYKSDNGYRFFPRMLFDPVDRSHIYIALKNQMRRVSVAQCGEYNTMGECRSAPDPLCGWCVSKSRCSIWQECHGSIWVNIPADVIKKELNISQVTLRLRVIVKGQGRPAYSCFFKTESGDLCETSSQTSVSVDCSCTFSSHQVSAEGQ